MNRGRASTRGTRRGASAAGTRSQAAASSTPAPSSTPTPAAGSSSIPAEASGSTSRATPSASTRGAATTRATRGPTTSRFRPKVVRRDEAQREDLARQEELKAQERAKEERRARGRSRFRSKRSRGDAMGARGGFGRIISGASGPFSSGQAGGGWFNSGSGPGAGTGFGGGGGGGSRSFKSESKPGFRQENNRYRETRINADKLNVNTPDADLDSEDEAMMEALSSRATTVLPMGIYRREHKDAEVVVATTAELEAAEKATGEEESLWVDGSPGEAPIIDQPEDGSWDTKSKKPVVVKKEPGVEEDSMDVDRDSKTPLAEDARQKVLLEAPKPKKTIPQDAEEKTIQADLNLIANELGSVTISEDGKAQPSNKDGRMYLFQFPPLMPPLKEIAAPQPKNKVKPEPGEDTNMLDSTPSVADQTPIDVDQPPAAEDAPNPDEDPERTKGFMSQLLAQGGLIGHLKVRKSGRAELDWGGRTLELSPAAGMNFLTTAVIVEENDEKPRPGVVGGESVGMGKIMGRFVLAPTWADEEEWDVAPEELRIDVDDDEGEQQ